LKIKRKSLIIEDSLLFAEPLRDHLISKGYDVIAITRSIHEAVKLISHYNLDLITLDLTLKDGIGLFIADYIVSNIQKLKTLPVIAVISEDTSNDNKSAISERLLDVGVSVLYFDKTSPSLLEYLSESLLKVDDHFSNNSNSYFNNSTLSHTEENTPIESFGVVIRNKLRNYNIKESSQGFEYLVFLIQEYVTNPPERNLIKELYDRAHHVFKIEPNSAEIAIHRLQLDLSPKKFIIRIAREIKEEYPELGL